MEEKKTGRVRRSNELTRMAGEKLGGSSNRLPGRIAVSTLRV